jgi:hypothetical protein
VTLSGWLAALVTATLLLLTIVCQRPRHPWTRRIKELDVLGVLPYWSFFAPRPMTSDSIVLWRERTIEGTLSPWQELAAPDGGVLRALWNPDQRQVKMVLDAVVALARSIAAKHDVDWIADTVAYRFLAHAVAEVSRSPLTQARQFVVVRQTIGFDDCLAEVKPLLASAWLEVAPARRRAL